MYLDLIGEKQSKTGKVAGHTYHIVYHIWTPRMHSRLGAGRPTSSNSTPAECREFHIYEKGVSRPAGLRGIWVSWEVGLNSSRYRRKRFEIVSIFLTLKSILDPGAHEAFGKWFYPMPDNRVFLVFLRK